MTIAKKTSRTCLRFLRIGKCTRAVGTPSQTFIFAHDRGVCIVWLSVCRVGRVPLCRLVARVERHVVGVRLGARARADDEALPAGKVEALLIGTEPAADESEDRRYLRGGERGAGSVRRRRSFEWGGRATTLVGSSGKTLETVSKRARANRAWKVVSAP